MFFIKPIIILPAIQFLLESLPISSSGHCLLFNKFLEKLNHHYKNQYKNFCNYQELLHIPTGMVLLFFLFNYASVIDIFKFLPALFICTITTGIIYFVHKFLDKQIFLIFGFVLTALVLFLNYLAPPGIFTSVSFTSGLVIGLAQSFALQPGVSRLALTFTAGRFLLLTNETSFIFSILAELLLVIAAIVKFSLKSFGSVKLSQIFSQKNLLDYKQLIIIFSFYLACLILSYYLLVLTWNIALNNSFGYFGYYMILPIISNLALHFNFTKIKIGH